MTQSNNQTVKIELHILFYFYHNELRIYFGLNLHVIRYKFKWFQN